MSNKFKVGDKVYISDKSRYVKQRYTNRKKIVGTIIEKASYGHDYVVIWSNSKKEYGYNKEDIIPVNQVKINIHK